MNEEQKKKSPLKIRCKACNQKLEVSDLSPLSVIACPVCNSDIVIPLHFDNYLLDRLEGVGGTSKVYRGTDLALGRQVAVKIMTPEAMNEPGASDAFLREARTAATLDHPAIITVFTCGISEGKPYIAMQYMSGGTLDAMLVQKKGPLPVRDTIRWISQIANALNYASKAGIIHHDVKPANIMLNQDGNAKIGDFGIAQFIKDKNTSEKDSVNWVSPEYVSPEKVTKRTEDHRGDIYSLGITLYQLLTGKLPFSGKNTEELMQSRLKGLPAAPDKLNRNIPESISQLIMKMISMKPEDRPAYDEIINVLHHAFCKYPAISGRVLLYAGTAVLSLCMVLFAGYAYNAYRELRQENHKNTAELSAELPAGQKDLIRNGELHKVFIQSKLKMNDTHLPPEVRYRYALTAYFSDSLNGGTECRKIAESFTKTMSGLEPYSMQAQTEKSLILLYLSNDQYGSSDFLLDILGAPKDAAAEAVFSVIIKELEAGKMTKERLVRMLEIFNKTGSGTWMQVWLPRVSIWQSALKHGQSRYVEPLLKKTTGGRK